MVDLWCWPLARPCLKASQQAGPTSEIKEGLFKVVFGTEAAGTGSDLLGAELLGRIPAKQPRGIVQAQ